MKRKYEVKGLAGQRGYTSFGKEHAKQSEVADLKEFFQIGSTPEMRKSEGLNQVFSENFPISDTRNNFVLEFLDYYIDPARSSHQR